MSSFPHCPSTRLVSVSVRAAVLSALFATGAVHAAPQACESINEKQVASLFDRWNASLKTLDPATVTANYARDGVLLPTVSDQPRSNPAEINDYFTKFLQSGPQGVIDKRFVKIGCNTAQDVGTYTFTFKDGVKVSARYTYVYEFTEGKWLIAHHHSSAMPERK